MCGVWGSVRVVARRPDVGQAGGSGEVVQTRSAWWHGPFHRTYSGNKNSACIMVVVGYMVVVVIIRNDHMSEMWSEERPEDAESGEVLPVLVPVAWDRSNREGEV